MRIGPTIDKASTVWTFLICCLLGYATYYLKVISTPAWTDGTLDFVHKQLVAVDYFNNEQSRVLQWGIPEMIVQVSSIAVRHAYALQRLVFGTLAFFVFHLFLLRWLRPGAVLACTALYALFVAFTAQNDLQESAPLLGLTFCAGLWAMRERKDLLFALLVWVGALNNETMLFLPALYLLVHAERASWLRTGLRAFLLGLPALITVTLIRYATRDLHYLGGGWHLGENIRSLGAVFLFLGPFWLLAVWRIRQLPPFLQRSIAAIPLFLLPNMMIGIITETRLLLPLTFFVLPAALWTLYPAERAPHTPDGS